MNVPRCAAIALVGWMTAACSGRGEVTVYGPGPDDDTRDREDDQGSSDDTTAAQSTGTGVGNLQQRCENWCVGSRNCPDSPFAGSECSGSCLQLNDLAAATGCESSFASLLDCVDSQQEICDAQAACAGSLSALSSCLSEASE